MTITADAKTGPRFIHLRSHSAFSLLEGALKLDQIIKFALADEAPAVGIADTNNLFGALEFSEKASKSGLQPIIGCQLDVDFADGENDRERASLSPAPLVLIAGSQVGYANLVEIVSKAYLGHEENSRPHVKSSWLGEFAEGVIVLTGGPNGPLGIALGADRKPIAEARLDYLKQIYGDRLYVELQRQSGYSRRIEAETLELAYAFDLPIVATNEPYFYCPDDFDAHDALLAVASNRLVSHEDRRRLSRDHCLKTQGEMAELFADLPEALDNTVEIARRCSFRPKVRNPILPRFAGADADPAEALREEAAELRRQAFEGLEARIAKHGIASGHTEEDYRARLDFELTIIEKMEFPGYFLIVADFIKWAKDQGIPVGPGRGSGAGSLVAYALTITDLDPLRFSLLFERFLNPERVSMPDFDIDFCQDRREEVIRYVQGKYGREQVGQIITFGTLQARAVLRDVGRVLEMSYGHVDKLCKLVPANPANPVTLAQALEEEPRLKEAREKEEIVDRLISMALKLEGLYRHASTHAAGIVIGDRPLQKLVPMYRDPRSDMPVTQFNMKWVEPAGLVKFDFLGLKTLTTLQTAVEFVKKRTGEEIDLAAIPLDDKASYEMLTRGETVGVFQLESVGMRKALIGMRPDVFEDIIALVALYRPGPMENIPTYNARKHGEEEPDFIHDKIAPILKETQGVIIYQEQVMQIAQVLSGYSLGEADMLRRAMGKKIRAEMDKQRVRFVDGAVERGVDKKQADMIFDLLAKFANYGFNKSHAAAYALVAYQTAYLKANYPTEFLAASMTLDGGNTEKLNEYRLDARRLGIEVVPPSVQTSFRKFEVGEKRIFYALSAIKGVGEHAVDHIVAKRGEKPFASLEDFCGRIDPKIINKRTFEFLIAAGAFDCFGQERALLMGNVEKMMGYAARIADSRTSGQADIFGSLSSEPEPLRLTAGPLWTSSEKLMREFQAIGFHLSAHPLDEYKAALKRLRVQSHSDAVAAVKRGASAVRLAGTVTSRQERKTRTGGKIGIIQMSDATAQYEVVLFSETLYAFRDALEPGASVIVTAQAEERPEGVSFRVSNVQSLEDEAVRMQKALRIFLRDEAPIASFQDHLKANGDSEVSIVLLRDDGGREVEIRLADKYRVSPQIASAIKAAQGVVDVELV
ncbi:DNA polymerase III subunit alpha [Fulvimarina endophytica]|uniref:DNA polymerase III subunit alpha n=1 Tax=Fulvimarina endophytica TaxID=2293836 RepID=A0A371X7S9_9HYPH|nr:DNA polymerase III subunit alpha [Fulvimarina endophytica]RFC65258.1 DNA polymerase III subunit alpha [Fulvimarina endophytica]